MLTSHKELKTPKRKFTEEEDKIIIEQVALNNGKKWDLIASELIDRTGQQVRERYVNYLKPNLTKEPWTSELDEQLIILSSQYNKKWSKIVKFFPGKTDVLIKNHYDKIKTKPHPSLTNRTVPQNLSITDPNLKTESAFDANYLQNDFFTWDSQFSNDYPTNFDFGDNIFN
jgi:hypothetical protein